MEKMTLIVLTMLFLPFSSVNPSGQTSNNVTNIILLIGDGMGFEHIKLASYVENGSQQGLFMQSEDFVHSSVTTDSSDDEITDSAASATAIATGYKTKNSDVGINSTGHSVETILEYAELLGKSSGLISTKRFYDATPAAFAAHVDDRGRVAEIVEDMFSQDIEVILGGGAAFVPNLSNLTELGYTYVDNKVDLLTAQGPKLVGMFTPGDMLFESDIDLFNDVRLSDMISKSLSILEKNVNGFFIMIESAKIDRAAHTRSTEKNVLETIQFDKGIEIVYNWVQDNPDTLVIITADHETGKLYINSTDKLDDVIINQSDTEENKRVRRIERVNQIDAEFQSTSHGPYAVPLIAFGKGSDIYINTTCKYSNAHIYGIMRNAFDGNVPSSCPDPILGYLSEPNTDREPDGPLPIKTTPISSTSTNGDGTFFKLSALLMIIPIILIKRKFVK